MGWIIYFTIKVLELIVKALKLWWNIICKCFMFIVLAVDELKTLKWEKEEDKPKIIKNGVIVAVGVLIIIFLIWLLVSIFNGNLGSSRRNNSSNKNSIYVQQTTEKKQETATSQNNNTQTIETIQVQETIQIQETTRIQETMQTETTRQTEQFNQTSLEIQTTEQQVLNIEQNKEESVVIETTQAVRSNDKEVKVVDKKKFTDHYEYSWTSQNDNYDVDHCEISITIPVIGGIDAEEAETINPQIEELAFQLIDKIKDDEVLSDKYNAVLNVNLDKHSIQYTEDKITIILNGSNKYASDFFQESSSYCAFVIEYDRNNQETKMWRQPYGNGYLHISTDEIFYAK